MTTTPPNHAPSRADRSEAFRSRIRGGLDRRDGQDLVLLAAFIECFCAAHHGDRGEYRAPQAVAEAILARRRPRLCADCAGLLNHSIAMRLSCPLEPKPPCKKCSCPCYAAAYRERIRAVMRYSGWRMILRGRLDYLWHYFF